MIRLDEVLKKFSSTHVDDVMKNITTLKELSDQGFLEFSGTSEDRFYDMTRTMGLLIPMAMEMEMQQENPVMRDIQAWHKGQAHTAFEKIAALAFAIGWASRGESEKLAKLNSWVVADEPKKEGEDGK